MTPTLLETQAEDTEFDLDVRLDAVGRDIANKTPERPTQITCTECTGGQMTCNC